MLLNCSNAKQEMERPMGRARSTKTLELEPQETEVCRVNWEEPKHRLYVRLCHKGSAPTASKDGYGCVQRWAEIKSFTDPPLGNKR